MQMLFCAMWQQSRALIEKCGSLALSGFARAFQWCAVRLLEVKTGRRTIQMQDCTRSDAPDGGSALYMYEHPIPVDLNLVSIRLPVQLHY